MLMLVNRRLILCQRKLAFSLRCCLDSIVVIFFLLSGLTSTPLFAAACAATDDTYTTISLARPAARIVSLAPDLTEILFAIGAGQKVVGAIEASDYPSAAKDVPRVGNYVGLDLEKIISLHPDLIVTWGNTFARQLAALKKLSVPIFIVIPRQLEDVSHTMRQLGCLAGVAKQAQKTADNYDQRLARIRRQYQSVKRIPVFYQIGPYTLLTINKESWINQMITLCGGQNVFANAKTIVPEVSWEAVMAADPSVVINGAVDNKWQGPWQKWSTISAVKNHLLFTIDPDLVERAGPRLLDGTIKVCDAIHQGRLKKHYLS